MTDPIADFLTRIRNAYLSQQKEVRIPKSKLKQAMAAILIEHGYASSIKEVQAGVQGELILELKYVGKVPSLSEIKRISKPGRRIYTSAQKIPTTLGGYGLTIVSTSKGIMTGKQAKKQNIGGELLAQVW